MSFPVATNGIRPKPGALGGPCRKYDINLQLALRFLRCAHAVAVFLSYACLARPAPAEQAYGYQSTARCSASGLNQVMQRALDTVLGQGRSGQDSLVATALVLCLVRLIVALVLPPVVYGTLAQLLLYGARLTPWAWHAVTKGFTAELVRCLPVVDILCFLATPDTHVVVEALIGVINLTGVTLLIHHCACRHAPFGPNMRTQLPRQALALAACLSLAQAGRRRQRALAPTPSAAAATAAPSEAAGSGRPRKRHLWATLPFLRLLFHVFRMTIAGAASAGRRMGLAAADPDPVRQVYGKRPQGGSQVEEREQGRQEQGQAQGHERRGASQWRPAIVEGCEATGPRSGFGEANCDTSGRYPLCPCGPITQATTAGADGSGRGEAADGADGAAPAFACPDTCVPFHAAGDCDSRHANDDACLPHALPSEPACQQLHANQAVSPWGHRRACAAVAARGGGTCTSLLATADRPGQLERPSVAQQADGPSGPGPVPLPPYEPFIRHRIYFSKIPGYELSQVTPGYEQRLALLVQALQGHQGAGGGGGSGGRRRLGSVYLRSGCIEVLLEEEEWGSGSCGSITGDSLSSWEGLPQEGTRPSHSEVLGAVPTAHAERHPHWSPAAQVDTDSYVLHGRAVRDSAHGRAESAAAGGSSVVPPAEERNPGALAGLHGDGRRGGEGNEIGGRGVGTGSRSSLESLDLGAIIQALRLQDSASEGGSDQAESSVGRSAGLGLAGRSGRREEQGPEGAGLGRHSRESGVAEAGPGSSSGEEAEGKPQGTRGDTGVGSSSASATGGGTISRCGSSPDLGPPGGGRLLVPLLLGHAEEHRSGFTVAHLQPRILVLAPATAGSSGTTQGESMRWQDQPPQHQHQPQVQPQLWQHPCPAAAAAAAPSVVLQAVVGCGEDLPPADSAAPSLEVLLRSDNKYLPLRVRRQRLGEAGEGSAYPVSAPAAPVWDEGPAAAGGAGADARRLAEAHAGEGADRWCFLELEVSELPQRPGVALVDFRWRGRPCCVVPLLLTADPAVAAELQLAVACWPQPLTELDELLLDLGTWEFHVAAVAAGAAPGAATATAWPAAAAGNRGPDTSAATTHQTAAATAAGVAATPAAAATAATRVPMLGAASGLSAVSPFRLVDLTLHLLRYAEACGWVQTARRLRRELARLPPAGPLEGRPAGPLTVATGGSRVDNAPAAACAADAAARAVSPGAGADRAVGGSGAGAGGSGRTAEAAVVGRGGPDGGDSSSGGVGGSGGSSAGSGVGRTMEAVGAAQQHPLGGAGLPRSLTPRPVWVREHLLVAAGWRRVAPREFATSWIIAHSRVLLLFDLFSGLTLLYRARRDFLGPSNVTTLVACSVSMLTLLARPFLPYTAWAQLVRASRLPRFFCYTAAKGLIALFGYPPPPGVRSYAAGAGLLVMEGVILPGASLLSPATAMLALPMLSTMTVLMLLANDPLESPVAAALIGLRTAAVGLLVTIACQAYMRASFWRGADQERRLQWASEGQKKEA